MEFVVKAFHNLNLDEFYRLAQLRSSVFVVEQNCVYLDLDDMDQKAHHVLGRINGKIHAYTRILPPGSVYESNPAIGRVITSLKVRNKGYGKDLMKQSITACRQLYPGKNIIIGAQTYLLKFYNSLGFEEYGEEYLEDGIPHYHMLLEVSRE